MGCVRPRMALQLGWTLIGGSAILPQAHARHGKGGIMTAEPPVPAEKKPWYRTNAFFIQLAVALAAALAATLLGLVGTNLTKDKGPTTDLRGSR